MSARVIDLTPRITAAAEQQQRERDLHDALRSETRRRELLASRVSAAILNGDIEIAKLLVDREETAIENAGMLSARLRDESGKQPESEAWNLAARVASGLTHALYTPERAASIAALRRATKAFAPLGVRNYRLDVLPKVDRKERRERLLRVMRGTVLVMARAAKFKDAAYVAYSATHQTLFPNAPDERVSVLPELEAWLFRYMRRESSLEPERDAETATGIARRVLQSFDMSPARAKDFFRARD